MTTHPCRSVACGSTLRQSLSDPAVLWFSSYLLLSFNVTLPKKLDMAFRQPKSPAGRQGDKAMNLSSNSLSMDRPDVTKGGLAHSCSGYR